MSFYSWFNIWADFQSFMEWHQMFPYWWIILILPSYYKYLQQMVPLPRYLNHNPLNHSEKIGMTWITFSSFVLFPSFSSFPSLNVAIQSPWTADSLPHCERCSRYSPWLLDWGCPPPWWIWHWWTSFWVFLDSQSSWQAKTSVTLISWIWWALEKIQKVYSVLVWFGFSTVTILNSSHSAKSLPFWKMWLHLKCDELICPSEKQDKYYKMLKAAAKWFSNKQDAWINTS